MLNQALKSIIVDHLLPDAQTPAQYIGGEWNAVVKDHRSVRGKLCLAFPDAYSIGMSHHGLQVLYDLMNRRDDWACERAFTPLGDVEKMLRERSLPLWSLETFTPLAEFDVLGFTLQYDLCYSNVLTMLDLGAGSGILAVAAARLGASRVYACDIDIRAAGAARERLRGEHIEAGVFAGSLRSLRGCSVDFLAANINAEALLSLAPEILRVLAPGGGAVLTGFPERHLERVRAAFPGRGRILEKGEWRALAWPGVRLS